jgi:hypothetical protein
MKRTGHIIFILACLACALAGCARSRGILVYSEEYWRNIIDSDPDFKPSLAAYALQAGATLTYIDAPRGINYFEHWRKILQDTPSDLVITGPLLCSEAMRIAPMFPAKHFAVLNMPRTEMNAPVNVTPVYSRRGPAFREAGRLTGKFLAAGGNHTLGRKVGVLVSGLTRQEKEMLAEFEKGFTANAEADLIIVEELGTVVDRVKAARAVEDLLNQDIRIFLVKTYGMSGACLERISAGGGYFIIEDFPSFNLFREKLFLSIEDDFSQPLGELIRAGNFNPSAPPFLPARVRKGPLLQEMKDN